MNRQAANLLRAVLLLLLAGIARAQEDIALRIGPLYRGGMEIRVTGSSIVQEQDLHAYRPGSKYARRAEGKEDDDITQYADRTFDDGFVFIDPSTEEFGGDTWYWGYQDADQVDPASDTLTFHRSDTFTETRKGERTYLDVLRDEPVRIEDCVGAPGLGAALDFPLAARGTSAIGLTLGLAGFWNAGLSEWTAPYEEQVTVRKWKSVETYSSDSVYTYDLMGVVPDDPPYEGTYEGPGPLLPNLPESASTDETLVSRNTSSSTSVYYGRNAVGFDVAADLYQFWFGPRLAWRPTERLELACTPRVSINLVDLSVNREERWWRVAESGEETLLGAWRHAASETHWRAGAGVQGSASWACSPTVSAGITAGAEWVDDCEARAGPNTVTFDPSGYLVGLELRKVFSDVFSGRRAGPTSVEATGPPEP